MNRPEAVGEPLSKELREQLKALVKKRHETRGEQTSRLL